MMDGESKEYNEKAMKEILNGLPDSIKNNSGKCSSKKDIWDKLHDLHSKGALNMTSSQENDGKQEGSLEPIKEAENKSDDIKAIEDLEDEENKEDFEEDLLTKLEQHFKIELPDYELQGVSDFRTLAARIQSRL